MMADAKKTQQTHVFLSYSRKDESFAVWLRETLSAKGIEVFRDVDDTLPGELWWDRLKSLIAAADAIIFILSPRSINSKVCRDELDFAETLKKRICPVEIEPIDRQSTPRVISGRHSVLFTDEEAKEAAVDQLIAALLTDIEWVREHTRLYQRAAEWQRQGRTRSELLSGRTLENAESWLTRQPDTAEPPTALHREYIDASRGWTRRRSTFVMSGLATASAVALGLATFAWWQREAAVENRIRAETTRNEALLSQSKVLAEFSKQATELGDPATGLLLALEALPDQTSTNEIARIRPHWPPAQVSLDRALRATREIAVLKGHTSVVTSVTVTPDGRNIISASWDGTARIWDAQSGVQLQVLRGHADRVASVAVSSDGSRIVTTSNDKTARVWDARTGAQLLVLSDHGDRIASVAVSPDGTRIVTGSDDETALVWDARTGAKIAELQGHDSVVTSVAFTKDGTRIVTCSWMVARVWDSKTMNQIGVFNNHTSEIESVAVLPDGKRIVTGSADGTARIWDISNADEIAVLGPRNGTVFGVGVTPDGARIITVSGSLSRDGARLMRNSPEDNRLRVWDSKTGAELRVIRAHQHSITSVAVTPDGARIVTGSEDRTVRIWDSRIEAASLPLKRDTEEIKAVAVLPDRSRIISGSEDGIVRVWDARTGVQIRSFAAHEKGVTSIAVSPDGSHIVTGSNDSTVRIWDAPSGRLIGELKDRDGSDWITGVAITPTGTRIIAGSGYFSGRNFSTDTSAREKIARVWDIETRTPVLVLKGHSTGITSVAVSSDGTRYVTGSVDGTARVWDASTGNELTVFRGHGRQIVTSVAVTPDGKRVISGSWDMTARVWDIHTAAELTVLKGHGGFVMDVAATPDGKRFVTGSLDGTARVWDASSGTQLAELKGHDGGVMSLAVAPSGSRIITGSEDGTTRVWKLFDKGQALIDRAKTLVPRCLTPVQRERYFLSPLPPDWCTSMVKWPYDSESVLIQGRSLVAEGKYNEAKLLFAEAVTRDPSLAERVRDLMVSAALKLAGNLVARGKDDEARTLFAQVLALDPNVARKIDQSWGSGYVRYARILLEESKDREAKVVFAKALARDRSVAGKIDEAWAAAYLERAQSLIRKSKSDDARALLAEAVRFDSSSNTRRKIANTYNNLAWKLFKNSKGAEGLPDAERAISLAPNDANILDTRGQIYLTLGKVAKGCADLNKSVAIGIDSPATYFAVGQCHEWADNNQRAIIHYKKALQQPAHDDFGLSAQTKAKQRLEVLTGPDVRTPINAQ